MAHEPTHAAVKPSLTDGCLCFVGPVQVPRLGLQEIVDGQNVAMLKMDCEGCEFEAVAGAAALFTDKSRIRSSARLQPSRTCR
jgi:FkbM family methyltransferase